ncbi:hypothetical protein MMC17_004452 [Xylographa soralifera]|nr:hypothetical protein [Xylographa soralifera]
MWIGKSDSNRSQPRDLGVNPLSVLSGAKFRALTERVQLPLGVPSDPRPGEAGYGFWELCPKSAENVTIQSSLTSAPVCSLMDAVEAVMKEVEHNDEMRPLPYNMEIRERRLNKVSSVVVRMQSRTHPENLEFSNNVRIYSQASLQTRNSLTRFLVMNRALCGKIAYALITMGDEIVNLKLEDEQIPDLQRKRSLIVIAHQHAVSEINNDIRQMLSDLSSLNVSARAMDEALLTIADDRHSYSERMTNNQVGFHKAKQYYSGWNEKTHAKLSEQQTYVSGIISDKFYLSTSLNETTVNLVIIRSMLEATRNRLDDYFSDSDVSTNMLAAIYHNLTAVHGRVLITQNTLIEANDLLQKVEYHMQRNGNLTEIPYSKHTMIDGVRSGPTL